MTKEEYAPLHQQDADDRLDQESPTEIEQYLYAKRRTPGPTWIYVVVIILVVCNGITLGLLFRTDHAHEDPAPADYAIPAEIPSQYQKFWWNTEYSSTNLTFQDELWESMLWTHGVIAMDRDYAKAQHWPDTMTLPSDSSKGVYVLEGYHEVHCLWILRGQFKKSLAGEDFANDPVMRSHIAHCFDFLLQVTMCNADSAPLYTWGTTYVGYGQQHKCKSWDALRNYATENTACFMESDDGLSLDEMFGRCDHGDGLLHVTEQEHKKG